MDTRKQGPACTPVPRKMSLLGPLPKGSACRALSDGLVLQYDHIANLSTLTITRVENAYCPSASINRLKAYKKGVSLYLLGNLSCDAVATTMSDFVKIASISGWSAIEDCYVTVSAQNDPTKQLVISVGKTGDVFIYNYAGTISSFYRFNVCIPAS